MGRSAVDTKSEALKHIPGGQSEAPMHVQEAGLHVIFDNTSDDQHTGIGDTSAVEYVYPYLFS